MGAKRDFKNELNRDITAGVDIGAHKEGYCRLYLYGPDSGIDSYVTRKELAMLYAVLHEVFLPKLTVQISSDEIINYEE